MTHQTIYLNTEGPKKIQAGCQKTQINNKSNSISQTKTEMTFESLFCFWLNQIVQKIYHHI